MEVEDFAFIFQKPSEIFIVEENVICTKAIKRDSVYDELFLWEYASLPVRPFCLKSYFSFMRIIFRLAPILLYNRYWVFPGCKVRPGRDADRSPPSSAEVKNRVELYLYSP